jgi:hypothetical protein
MRVMIGIVMAFSVVGIWTSTAFAEDRTGVTATEIKIGNTMPCSGPSHHSLPSL